MTVNFLEYPLQAGHVQNWLVCGPVSASDPSIQLNPPQSPVDRDEVKLDGASFRWRYLRCGIDHLADLSPMTANQRGRAWAFTQLHTEQPQSVTLNVTTAGPVEVWLNGQPVNLQPAPAAPGWQCLSFATELQSGDNALWVKLDQAGGDARLAVAVQLGGEAVAGMTVRVPTRAERAERHQRLERLLDYAYLEDVVNYRGQHFNLRWAPEIGEQLHFTYQLEDDQERIYVTGKGFSDVDKPLDVGQEYRVREAPMWLVLRAVDSEFYEQNLRYRRALPIYIVDAAYADAPYSDFASRNQEALKDAVRHENNLFAEIAKMQLGSWKIENWTHKSKEVNPKVILSAIETVKQPGAEASLLLVGLLGIAYRYLGAAEFPESLKAPLESCLQNAAFGGSVSESESILWSAAEILAGQRYPKQVFPSGQTGAWHRQHGEQIALEWLKARGATGFTQWNSSRAYELYLVALAHLTSLAEDETVRELAAVLMDKIFFLMAVNSYKGAFGSSQGDAAADAVKSHQLEAVSGIQRMMWGMGEYNAHVAGVVSLVGSGYEFPLLLAEIATALPSETWNLERHQTNDGAAVQAAAYKTPDYMLASALDYRPGQLGNGEHIWQATFGPEAIVFVNHPGAISEKEAHRAGWWRGNAILPRLAQWKDALISVVKLPPEDRLGFTHAYFPTSAFDETIFRDGWAFARKGAGYLALTAQRGLELIHTAPDGYRELRSYGSENIWICQMGRAELDGSFEDFQQKVLFLNVEWQPSEVSFTALRGQALTFGWQGPLKIDGQPQALGTSKHIENPYCTADFPATQIEIGVQDTAMRLNFE